MGFVQTVVNKPTTMLIIFLLLVGIGFYCAQDLAIDLYPDIEIPMIVVTCENQGSGPSEIENRVTRIIESTLGSVSGVTKITSSSSESYSTVMLEFDYGADLDVATNDVRDKLEIAKRMLPDEAESPMIFKFDPSMIPMLFIAVRGDRTPEELWKVADDVIVPRLEQISGVASVSINGGRERVIRVEVSQNRLNALNLSLTDIASSLARQNVEVSAGSITKENIDFLVQTAGEYHSVEELKETVIAYKGNSVVRLDDVAHVFDGYEDETSSVTYDNEPIVRLAVQKQSGSNSVQVADAVLARIPQIEKDMPKGVTLTVTRDTTQTIRNSIAEVVSSAVSGGILAILVLFFFLRDIRATLIIGTSIPVSVVITLLFMYLGGLSLNLMTLSGLTLGIGMLVDNSIVILENIFKYREKGAKLKTAATLGTTEMITAIMASTLTTICVFLPIIMFKSQLDVMGEMIGALAFTVVVSLVSSILVAATLVPVLSSHYFPIQSKLEKNHSGIIKIIDDTLERFFRWLDSAYKKGLNFVLHHRKLTVGTILFLLIASIMAIPKIGIEFAPMEEADAVTLKFELPLGTAYEVTKDISEQLKLIIEKEIRGYESITVIAGAKQNMLSNANSYYGEIQIKLPDYNQRIDRENTIKEKLRKHFDSFPNVIFTFSSNGGGMGSSTPIDFAIKSNDLDKALETATKIKQVINESVPDATEPDIDMRTGLPEIEITVDREKAYSFGLSIAAIANEIKANIDGITPSYYREGGDEYDILVVLQEEDRTSLTDLEKIFVMSPTVGKRIPLSNIAKLIETTGPVTINRENQMRVIHVTAGLKKGAKLNEVIAEIEKQVTEQIPKDEAVFISVAGDMENLKEIGSKMVMIIVIAISLVFGVMASQFESFIDPFIIIFTMPLMIIGVVGFYLLNGETFSMLTAIGLIVLLGVVVNNGIVLVDYTNLLRKRGKPIIEACIEAGGSRLRPILMTTLTTVLGLIPMAFARGEGSSLMKPIAQTLVGGLTTSTIFTLFLIPVLYSIINEMTEKWKIKRETKQEEKMELRRRRLLEMHKQQHAQTTEHPSV